MIISPYSKNDHNNNTNNVDIISNNNNNNNKRNLDIKNLTSLFKKSSGNSLIALAAQYLLVLMSKMFGYFCSPMPSIIFSHIFMIDHVSTIINNKIICSFRLTSILHVVCAH